MASLLVTEAAEKYRQFVRNNVKTVGQLESLARFVSYLAPGLTATTSELLSSIASLVSLYHDSILRNAADMHLDMTGVEKTIGIVLTVIDNVEVFLEIAAYGSNDRNTRRWLAVAAVQLVKAVLHLMLLFKYKAGIVPSPPIPMLKRNDELIKRVSSSDPARKTDEERSSSGEATGIRNAGSNASYKLQSSGRKIRSLNADQGTLDSAWDAAVADSVQQKHSAKHTALDGMQIVAECLHIMRPIVHLISLFTFGQLSWKPWLIAFGVDCSSLCMIGDSKGFYPQEKEEIKRRAVLMLLYLLRSPFYDRYSKERLLFCLGILAYKVPIVRRIALPLLEYLPIFQQTYSYVWAV